MRKVGYAISELYSEACKPIMKDKKFLTDKEYIKNRGKLSILAGAVHRINRELKTKPHE